MSLRETARGQHCRVRLPGVCNNNPETTVLAHIGGAGMGIKQPDVLGAFCCSSCHDVVDGRVPSSIGRDLVRLWHWDGVGRTIRWWIENGYLEVGHG